MGEKNLNIKVSIKSSRMFQYFNYEESRTLNKFITKATTEYSVLYVVLQSVLNLSILIDVH
jgi:hypothetical protein